MSNIDGRRIKDDGPWACHVISGPKARLNFSLIAVFIIGLLFPTNFLHAEPIKLLNPSTPNASSLKKPLGVSSLESFKRIAVLEDGRVKPMDTYAQNVLLQFSGKRRVDKEPAVRWFARFIFAPETTTDDKIFLINNPEIPMALGLEPDHRRRYSFSQIEPHFEKLNELSLKASAIDKKNRSIVEEEIIRVETAVKLYAQLLYTFNFAFPNADFTVNDKEIKRILKLPDDQNQFSFLDIAERAEILQKVTEPLSQKPQSQWNAGEKEILNLVGNLYQWSMTYKDLPFHLIPSYDDGSESWLSPWDAIAQGFKTPTGRAEINTLADLIKAYWNGQQLEFDIAAKTFNESVTRRSDKRAQKSLNKIDLELLYNRLDLFLIAKIFYALAFILFLCSLFSKEDKRPRKGGFAKGQATALAFVVVGFAAHAFALIMRITIMARPPVTNLYETFIFVGFVSVLVGLIVERVNKHWLGIVIAGVSGFIFLTIASKFSAEGDTLRMLVAVLNSNFWLSTHVLSITTGYAGVCVAGIIGHVYILQALAKPHDKKLLDDTYRYIMGVLAFGLTMSFLGTNLGGIWADQSWGRFWGWDPKENGAMLIVLWCAIVFHAKIGRLIGPLGVAAASVFGMIVVTWAWFGVNLLSVGLHSYGFTSGIFNGIIIYVVFQLLFIVITVPLAKKRLRHA